MIKKSKGRPPLKKTLNETNEKLLFILKESIPISQTERKKYVSDIAFFYSTIFKDKLQHFIGLQLEELGQIGRTELMYSVYRSNINCFRLIDEWMNLMTNEHIGNVNEIRNSFPEEREFINEMKSTYGKV